MALYLTDAEVGELLPMPDLLTALADLVRAEGEGQAGSEPRRRAAAGGAVLNVMCAAAPAIGRLGLKVNVRGQGVLGSVQARRSAGAAPSLCLLWSDAGELLAIMQADRLGQLRTGAATGVASRLLARPESETLALLGSGWQAEAQVTALAAALPRLRRARVWSRDPEHGRAFCARLATQVSLALEPVASAEAAVRGADVVVTATKASTPVLSGEWLAPGMHVNAIGSNLPAARELDAAAVLRADRIVIDSRAQAALESGDLLPLVAAGRLRWEEMPELAAVAAGKQPGRTGPEQVTLFKSHGVALWDLAAANLAYARADARGAGRDLVL